MKSAAAPPLKKPKTYIPAFDFKPEEGVLGVIGNGLHWLRLPLPFELNHINLWLMESKTGWTIVDTGFNFQATLEHWEKIFTDKFKTKPVETIFITHFHPDHFGLAGWLSAKTGITAQMTQGEHDIMRQITEVPEMLEELYRPFYVQAGVAPAMVEELLLRRFNYKEIVSTPPALIDIVKIGDTVSLGGSDWEIVGGYGHCPEHACLYNAPEKLFISGDIVLPDISPNISFFPSSSDDPVDDYLKSLDSIKKTIPDDVTVFPSHGVPFKGLHRRIDELKAHHDKRFAKLREIMKQNPMTAFEIMHALFAHRVLKTGDLFFALGETLAHVIYEERRGRIKSFRENDILRYSL